MGKKEEIYQDITKNCNIILDLLNDFTAENETPEGRMIYQCNWLKEQIAANTLPLPVDDYVQTLNYITAEKLLTHLASSDDNYNKEVGIYLYRLCYLVENKLLNKVSFFSNTIRLLNVLQNTLNNASRKLDQHEKGLIKETEELKKLFLDKKIEPPLISYTPNYINFIEVEGVERITIDDLPKGKELYKTITNLVFEGIRPDSWLTPEDADKETKQFIS